MLFLASSLSQAIRSSLIHLIFTTILPSSWSRHGTPSSYQKSTRKIMKKRDKVERKTRLDLEGFTSVSWSPEWNLNCLRLFEFDCQSFCFCFIIDKRKENFHFLIIYLFHSLSFPSAEQKVSELTVTSFQSISLWIQIYSTETLSDSHAMSFMSAGVGNLFVREQKNCSWQNVQTL